MSDIVIKAEGIGKSYLIGHQSRERYVAFRDVIVNKARGWLSTICGASVQQNKNIEEFWAGRNPLNTRRCGGIGFSRRRRIIQEFHFLFGLGK